MFSIPLALSLKPIELVLNHALHADPQVMTALAGMSNQCFAVEIRGLQQTVYLQVHAQGIQLSVKCTQSPVVTLNAAPFSLLHLLLQPEQPLTGNPDIQIHGDASALHKLVRVFKQLNLDWEEVCARYLGDIPAHQLGSAWRATQQYGNTRWQSFQCNLSEYLQEESKHLPASAEMNAFLTDIDTLRDDTERLAQRLYRLQKSLTKV